MTQQIPLRNRAGAVVASATVDDDDYERVSRWRWSLSKGRNVRRCFWHGKHEHHVGLARHILGLTKGDGRIIRYADGDPLNCTRANLLVVPRPVAAPPPLPDPPVLEPLPDDLKVCTVCHEAKPRTAFSPRRDSRPGAVWTRCKACSSVGMRAWTAARRAAAPGIAGV